MEVCLRIGGGMCAVPVREVVFEGTEALARLAAVWPWEEWQGKQEVKALLDSLRDLDKFGKDSRSYVKNKILPNIKEILKE